MKQRTMSLVMTLILALAIGSVGGAAQTSGGVLPENVETALKDALLGPEGEYAAYAAYAAVLKTYGEVEPYATIARAELRHIAALERLFTKYDIEIPSENPYLRTIPAPADLETAANAWAEGEIANVALYDRLLSEVADYPDITRVFLNLRSSSQDAHLPAFQHAAENGGTMTQSQVHSSHSHDRGRRR
jgi:hypothetical protein